MDFSLAALKLFCSHLKDAQPASSPSAMTLGGILFQRAWLQGILVSGDDEGCYVLDDGSDIIEFHLTNESKQEKWKIGMHVMVIGVYVARRSQFALIKVHKIVDLSGQPDREAMWHLEVIEAYKLFYQSSYDE